jgi:hypothetical protein
MEKGDEGRVLGAHSIGGSLAAPPARAQPFGSPWRSISLIASSAST